MVGPGPTPGTQPAGQPVAGPAEPGGSGQTRTVAKDSSVLHLVPGGRFLMGDPADPKRVDLAAFYIDRLEVTNEQYAQFLADVKAQGDGAWRHPQQPPDKKSHVPSLWEKSEVEQYLLPADRRTADFWKGPLTAPRHPVVGVDWFDAYAYAAWAGKRLPTEAEWERAARGTDGRPYPWGDAPPEQRLTFRANYFSSFMGADGYKLTAPVGTFPDSASPAGCLNMAGNVSEWCADFYAPLPEDRRLTDPKGPAAGTDRVVKGGAWNLSAASLRTYSRMRMSPTGRQAGVGFRCAQDAAPSAP